MTKKRGTFRNSLFFLLGVLVYSFFFWLTGQNYVHVFGALLVALIGYLLYAVSGYVPGKDRIHPKDVIFMCIGIVFDSFSGGFPFSFLNLLS